MDSSGPELNEGFVRFDTKPYLCQRTLSAITQCESHPFTFNTDEWGLELENDPLHPNPAEPWCVLNGTIHFHLLQVNGSPIEFDDLYVIFNGVGRVKFPIDLNGKSRNILREELLFQPETPALATNNNPVFPYQFTFIKAGKRSSRLCGSRGKNLHSFPFKLNLGRGQELPASFKGQYGGIYYCLCFIGWFQWRFKTFFVIAEKQLDSKGYVNLTGDLSFKKQVKSADVTKTTFANGSNPAGILRGNLVLERDAVILGEQLNFTLNLENPSCEFVGVLSVILVQKIMYAANSRRSTHSVNILQHVNNRVNKRMTQIQWKGVLDFSEDLMPTSRGGFAFINAVYAVQFTVEVRGKIWLKGEMPIVVGTSRNGEVIKLKFDLATPISSKEGKDEEKFGLSSIFGSMFSIPSSESHPPSYSKLSSRRTSVDTLPPNYEDILE